MRSVLSARNPDRFSPVFVLATARSYSSVVTTMIGQHPDLAGLPELKLFCFDTIGELEKSLPRFWIERGIKHRSPGLVRAVAQFEFGGQDSDNLTRARAWLGQRSRWSGAEVLDALLAGLSPRDGVEKSPENVESEAALERLASAYPRARFLHLTRHPVSTQRSLQEHYHRILPGYELPGQPMSGIASWVEVQCRILGFVSTLPRERWLRVRSEDVLNDSGPRLRSIAAWLRVRDDDAAIESMMHPEASPFASLGPADSGIIGGNDPSFLRDARPRPAIVLSSLDQPPGWVGHSNLWQSVVEVCDRLGYL